MYSTKTNYTIQTIFSQMFDALHQINYSKRNKKLRYWFTQSN